MRKGEEMRKILCFLLIAGVLGCTGEKPADKGKSAQMWLETGMAQFQKQDYDAAIVSFTKAAEYEGPSAVSLNMLGMAYRFKYNQVRNKELKDKEIAAFQKAIEVDPNYWVALMNLGATYYFLGEKAKAVPLFKKALEINPQHPEKEQLLRLIAEEERKG
jgi:tetratricopeptide (TPR) repeat protein